MVYSVGATASLAYLHKISFLSPYALIMHAFVSQDGATLTYGLVLRLLTNHAPSAMSYVVLNSGCGFLRYLLFAVSLSTTQDCIAAKVSVQYFRVLH